VLVELHIESLGVIEQATLTLGRGLTALTGETGAGKTMLVDAVDVLVGGRAEGSMVRAGANEARVEGRFVVDDQEFVLTRVIPAEGRSRAYVNGRPATAASLAEMARGTVDLHGQHAHQALLSAAAQRRALDIAAIIDLAPLRQAQARLTGIEAELATLGGDERTRAREIDLLRYQVGELQAAGLAGPDTDVDEDAALDAEEDLLADAQAHREAVAQAYRALVADGGAADGLLAALRALAGRAPFAELYERLAALAADLDDVGDELRTAQERIDEDPARLDAIRQRRQLLRELCRKYGDDVAEVVAFHAQASARLAELDGYTERAARLSEERSAALDALDRAARAVGDARRSAAGDLARSVQQRLRQLAMPNAKVLIDVGSPPDDPAGDVVRFLLAANPGTPALPLAQVASGGELSRTMLALRLVLSAHDDGAEATLIFDEVDAGVGGRAATAVGEALSVLGARHQVMVVTHLAQVAALATTQIVVDKHVERATTRATATAVDGDARVEEIARMLSGSPDSDAARQHAAELLSR
jgi:DNA repair protein RecN (Recombination protein N)